ncbi:MarR family winged helix-turn-helix transcriptional regulator [Agreia sp. COWG]|uniref:MarR family winged helix-turn-helix transcriptional regulator n=1 Tax=Agreia sp. COWG TaxID=2773266 RepID=UPI0019257E67|nr:MarR family transcriptional regulator [Agreia sp. COWG]CAD5991329.1 DNA-binding transcriptional regulator, MarR family [Agreia sp. COWG]
MSSEPPTAAPGACDGTASRAGRACSSVDDVETADLTWLMHRASEVLRGDFDAVAKAAGLADLRDWLVLSVVTDGIPRTQLEIARQLGIDKTTLIAVLDRLEGHGFIVRSASTTDRRVRIPEATKAGAAIFERVTLKRDAALADRLAGVPESEQQALRSALWAIASAPTS